MRKNLFLCAIAILLISVLVPWSTRAASPTALVSAGRLLAGVTFTRYLANPPALIQAESETKADGFALAWGIVVLMMAGLIYAGVVFLRAFQGKRIPLSAAWVNQTIPVLCLLGMVIAGYLTYVETQSVKAICGPVGDCNAVQSSRYATLFGFLPVGVLGLLGYIAILAAWIWSRVRKDTLAEYAPVAIFGMTLFGTLFSIYLTYLELFVIYAVCIWCISSATVTTLLLFASTAPAAKWVAAADEED